jgi:signal transduction histidine kinase
MRARDDVPMVGRAGSAPPWDAAKPQDGAPYSWQDQAEPGTDPSAGLADASPEQTVQGTGGADPAKGTAGTGTESGRTGQRDWRSGRSTHGLLSRWIRGPGSDLPLRRERDGKLAGGVLAGLSAKTGVDVTALRVGLVVVTLLTSGLGAAAYVVAWLLLPVAGQSSNIASRAMTDKRGIGMVALLASVLGVLLIVASALKAGWLNAPAWPIIISVCGMVLIWRNADPDEQAMLRRLAEPVMGPASGRTRERMWLRVLITAFLLGVGLVILLSGHRHANLLAPVGGILLILAGSTVALGPWWLRIARDLVAERQARIRAEERADMAARVHDSVLQTLALIQRRATEPQQVVQLARMQERELRAWLFDDQAPGSIKGEGVTLAAGIRQIQQDVEAQHGIEIDAVTVGDCDLDEDLEAMLAAAREATVNAAKWSGSDTVSLFAEVEPEAVSLFVRDRGCGFDPEAIPGDRKGLAESVRARMARRGGSAVIRSAAGQGTEVTLTMPRTAGDRTPRRT